MKNRLDEGLAIDKRWSWRRVEQERRSVFCNAATALCVVGPLAAMSPRPTHIAPAFWMYITLAGLSQCLGLAAALTAYKGGELSVVAPLATLRPLLAMPFTIWLLGQRYTTFTTVGIVIVLVSAAALEYEPRGSIWASLKALAHNKDAMAYLAAGVFWAPFAYLFKMSVDSVKGGSPFFVSVPLLSTMVILTLPIRRYSWQILHDAFRRKPVINPRLYRHAYQRILPSQRLSVLYAIGAVIMTLQQYTEVTSYRIGKNTVVVLAIFKLYIPLTLIWERLLPKDPKPGESAAPKPLSRRLFWQRFAATIVMTFGAFLAS